MEEDRSKDAQFYEMCGWITLFNGFIQKQQLYQFLAGINDTFDKERKDLLNQDPLPTLNVAYATIRREIARHGIMSHTSSSGLRPLENS